MDWPLTLEEFNRQMQPIYKKIAAQNAQRILELENDLAFWGYKPLSKWERRKNRVKRFLYRFVLAWHALRGDDLILDQ